ncbi:MAG TPA: sulfatase/phosphatase domain-containing protein, partial [Chthonomonadaceae bacterium]|nr:sulfatase/phosphatase domain-containing protein [Chthonomonadaceae bacterium]
EPQYDYWELFDLRRDPHELKSVFADKSYAPVRQDLERRLAELRVELKLPAQDPPESVLPAPRGAPAGR